MNCASSPVGLGRKQIPITLWRIIFENHSQSVVGSGKTTAAEDVIGVG